MGKCVVKGCNSRSQVDKKASGITFHSVPKDPVRRKKWMKIIRLLRKDTYWIPAKTSVICSKHFREQDKIPSKSNNGRVYLSDEAIPVVVGKLCSEAFPSAGNTDTEFKVESKEEKDEITESPIQLKMGKTIERLKLLSTKRLKKIKLLSQRNRRLLLKNKKLKVVIKDLKRKILGEGEVMQLFEQ